MIDLLSYLLIIYFLLPVKPLRIAPPILRSRPCLVVGIPTVRATFVFKPEIPTARLSEKLSPGIFAIIVLVSVEYNGVVLSRME